MSEQMKSVEALIKRIKSRLPARLRFMEVCGTHTTAIARSGLRSLLKPEVELVSGPGCPVCVTAQADLDHMIALARLPDLTVVTFGDMLRVPGSETTLEAQMAAGADIRIVYSPIDAVKMAAAQRKRQFVFLGVGFETTAPAVALSVELAQQMKLGNYSVYSCIKTMPPALHALLQNNRIIQNGLLLPGHVSAVIGRASQDFVSRRYHLPAAIAGFEPIDILYAIFMLADMAAAGRAAVVNCYPRVVREEGNPAALALIRRVFTPSDAAWRGLGLIKQSGLSLCEELAGFDARLRYPVSVAQTHIRSDCCCARILQGEITPPECGLFGDGCSPLHPEGPCMVSSEGACAAYYRYERSKAVNV
ncbi:MAG: hydrogenase formation protein HypD [Bacillota bacterium]|nr:hydrogenase formation protein HypD [Bacillota bacterium]MDW7684927.1 hydrogenase formation protein HypD [Bacillota bacterium]